MQGAGVESMLCERLAVLQVADFAVQLNSWHLKKNILEKPWNWIVCCWLESDQTRRLSWQLRAGFELSDRIFQWIPLAPSDRAAFGQDRQKIRPSIQIWKRKCETWCLSYLVEQNQRRRGKWRKLEAKRWPVLGASVVAISFRSSRHWFSLQNSISARRCAGFDVPFQNAHIKTHKHPISIRSCKLHG